MRRRSYPTTVRYPVCLRWPVTEDDLGPDRPQVRADCADSPRPCPFVSCKYNLFLDLGKRGEIEERWSDIEPDAMPHSCTLDVVASEGAMSVHDMAEHLQLDPDKVGREVGVALNSMRYRLARSRMGREFKDSI